MKEQEHSLSHLAPQETLYASDRSNVLSMQEYLDRHPNARQNLGRCAVKRTVRPQERFPVILMGNEPDQPA
jgi:hypothetical protein